MRSPQYAFTRIATNPPQEASQVRPTRIDHSEYFPEKRSLDDNYCTCETSGHVPEQMCSNFRRGSDLRSPKSYFWEIVAAMRSVVARHVGEGDGPAAVCAGPEKRVERLPARGMPFRVEGSGLRVQGSGFRDQGSGSRVEG